MIAISGTVILLALTYGLLLLILLIPIVDSIMLLNWLIRNGTAGDNMFGPDPFDTTVREPDQQQPDAGRKQPLDSAAKLEKTGEDTAATPTKDLERLVETYVATRRSMKSGEKRTSKMTLTFHSMRGKAERIGSGKYDARSGLNAEDGGINLAAIAYVYTFPDAVKVHDLIGCVERSNQPFVQYWGLKTIWQILLTAGVSAFAPHDIESLRKLAGVIKPGTDRSVEIVRINAQLDRLTQSGSTA